MLTLNENLRFVDPTVSRSKPTSELKLYNIPTQLRLGDLYVGLVSVQRADGRTCPVAFVEVEII